MKRACELAPLTARDVERYLRVNCGAQERQGVERFALLVIPDHKPWLVRRALWAKGRRVAVVTGRNEVQRWPACECCDRCRLLRGGEGAGIYEPCVLVGVWHGPSRWRRGGCEKAVEKIGRAHV